MQYPLVFSSSNAHQPPRLLSMRVPAQQPYTMSSHFAPGARVEIREAEWALFPREQGGQA